MIKNREHGSLSSNLVRPCKFLRYKDFDRYACILSDDGERKFDCSV